LALPLLTDDERPDRHPCAALTGDHEKAAARAGSRTRPELMPHIEIVIENADI
jgi:hypothetical protein